MSPSVQPSQTAVTAPTTPANASNSSQNAQQTAASQATQNAKTVQNPNARTGAEAPATLAPGLDTPASTASSVTGKASESAPGVTTSASSAADPVAAGAEAPASREAAPVRTSAAQAAWLGKNGGHWSERAIAFNRYPHRYAHPSWIPENWGPWMEKLKPGTQAEAAIGGSLLGHWKLAAKPCFDFTSPARRLALVDGEPLRRTVLLAGVARHADAISRLMERAKVKELKDQVGEEAYKFAMFRAPLLAGPLAKGGNDAAPAGADWKTRCMAAGMGMFGACLAGGPEGLSARAGLKFPREYAPYLAAGGGEGSQDGYLRLFRKVLAQEVDPAWDSLLS